MGIYSLIPPLIVIILAIRTKSSLIPLVAGCVIGYLMLAYMHVDPSTGHIQFGSPEPITSEVVMKDGTGVQVETETEPAMGFPENFINGLYKVMMLNENGEGADFNGTYYNSLLWVLIVCGLFGPFIQLMIVSGGVTAIGHKLIAYLKNRKQSLMATYFLGFIFFVDDYLSTLSVGATMRNVTDKFGVPREKLGYVIGAVSVPLTVIVPISTWSVYVGGLMISEGGYPEDASAIGVFIKSIPYNIYAWVAMGLALLYVLGLVPDFKKFKEAQARVDAGGSTIPPDSESLALEVNQLVPDNKASVWSFLIPMFVLVATTMIYGFYTGSYDIYIGIMVALTWIILQYWIFKILPFSKIIEQFEEGFKSMTFVLVVLIVTYLLKQVGDEMGLTDYVVGGVKQFPVEFLPVMIFLSIGAIAVATGSSWGVYAVVTPIIFALAKETGMNPMLGMGALISAGIWGANMCFYSDSRILTASATESNMTAQAVSQLPYTVIVAVASALLFLILGYIV